MFMKGCDFFMSSVTERIKNVKQPRGGYIKPSAFNVVNLSDGRLLCDSENVHASLVGLVVDYFTRYLSGKSVQDAFLVSLKGADCAEKCGFSMASILANECLCGISGLNDESIINACKLVTFDVWFRNPAGAFLARTIHDVNPDGDTVNNIKIMIQRSISFFDKYGPVVADSFDFNPYGYTDVVSSGDGDFLTFDTLWDFKVSKSSPTNKNTLQLLMYYIMGLHSGQDCYKTITNLGIFNPRLNNVYLLNVNDVSHDVILDVEKNVICY